MQILFQKPFIMKGSNSDIIHEKIRDVVSEAIRRKYDEYDKKFKVPLSSLEVRDFILENFTSETIPFIEENHTLKIDVIDYKNSIFSWEIEGVLISEEYQLLKIMDKNTIVCQFNKEIVFLHKADDVKIFSV